jgi:hypothetical protein
MCKVYTHTAGSLAPHKPLNTIMRMCICTIIEKWYQPPKTRRNIFIEQLPDPMYKVGSMFVWFALR